MVPDLLKRLPGDFKSYHEPFMGGGALFFALHRKGLLNDKEAFLSDVNQELVDTYIAIRDRVEAVIRNLKKHDYNKEHYYEVRSWEPSELSLPKRAARMIFLNRAGFNGLYRVNSKGKFNVPFGRYVNPTICNSENLRAVALTLKQVTISCESFDKVMGRARKNDLVYFDPPYVPLSRTAKFVSYASDGFGFQDQEHLADVFARLSKKGVRVMLSNSDTPWVRRRYEAIDSARLDTVLARRSVNSCKDRRGPIGELVVLNYPVTEND